MTFHELANLTGSSAFWFMASPYTHEDKGVMMERAYEANAFAAELMVNKIIPFCTIWTTHHASVKRDLPCDFRFWYHYNKLWLDLSYGTIVACIDGWQQSQGVAHEMEYTRTSGKPMFLMRREEDVFSLSRVH